MRVCRWSAGSPSSSAFAGVILFILAAAAPAAAADPKEIRDRSICPAELLVVRADARKYFEAESGAPLARGLRNRISAALATLSITCRRYAAATSMPFDDETEFVARIRQLRRWFGAGERMRFTEALDALTGRTPFPIAHFLHDRHGDQDERDAGAVYRQLCHGCHAAPMVGSENPAEPLDDMARSLPREEFFARMLLGVRGTPEIGLSNPLTASEIGAMRRFLVAGRTPRGELDRSPRR